MDNLNCDTALIPDWIWAVMTILQEARNQSLDGMIGVAEVIRNRTQAKFYSDGTILSTVMHPYQFSGWNSKDPNRIICGKMKFENPLVGNAIKAWKIAIQNDSDLTQGAKFYHTKTLVPYPDWARSGKLVVTTTIEAHIFYKEKI